MHPYSMARANRTRAAGSQINGNKPAPIIWTDEERRAVAREAFRIASERSITQTRAVLQAQQILPPERQRPATFAKAADLTWLAALWTELKNEAAKKGAQDLFEPTPNGGTENVPKAAPLAEAIAEIATKPEPMPVQSKPDQETSDAAPSSSEPSSKGDKPRIFWRDEEKRALIAKTREYMQRYPDMSKIEALRKAQGVVLKPDRQREGLTGWTFVADWADPMLAQLEIDEQIAEHHAREQRDAEQRAEIERQARIAAEEAVRAERERVEALRFESAVTARVDAMGFDGLIQAFARKMARDVIEAMGDEFQNMLTRKVADAVNMQRDARQMPIPKDRAPRVGVVGLLNQQEQDIKRAFQGAIDFVFVKAQAEGGSGAGGVGMLASCKNCDIVIAMTDHIGHDVTNAMRKLGTDTKLLTGSASSLKRYLSAWLHSEGK